MESGSRETLEEDANGLALICRLAVQARAAEHQLPFLEALLADLTEVRDDLLHQAATSHHTHQEL